MSSISAAQTTSAYPVAGASFQVHTRPRLSAMLILAADVIGMSFALWISLSAFQSISPGNWQPRWTVIALLLLLYWLFDLYPGVSINPVAEIRGVSLSNACAFLLACMVFLINEVPFVLFVLWFFTCIATSAVSLLMRAAIRKLGSQFNWWGYPVALCGAGTAAVSILHRLISTPHLGLRPVAVIADRAAAREMESFPIFKSEYLDQIASAGVKHVVVAAPELTQSEFTELIQRGGDVFPHLILIPDTNFIWKTGAYARDLTGILGIQVRNNLLNNGSWIVKRSLDLFGSILLAIILSPLLIIISILIVLESGFPIFYFQKRLGRGGRSFHMWKFRTMSQNSTSVLDSFLAADPELRLEWTKYQKLRNDPRVTRFGRVLRRTSLDELPQLWNVIKGEMSLVGPRPYLAAQLVHHKAAYAAYVKTTPGLTGLWQVSGRNRTTLAKRMEYDAFYVRNWSVWMDIYLLAKTIGAVLSGDGAY